ncbi:MAG: tetratricopeptide repeat protein [Symploca sp. SIO2E9]|nr:tetratricopeptide repeat protein [Symploca sp. SIO2E9]
MNTGNLNEQPLLSSADHKELTKLVNAVALSEDSLSLFAVAPEISPEHPVVEQFKTKLEELEESFQFLLFHYSDNSLFKFLTKLDSESAPDSGRRIILAFGLEKLPLPRLKQAMEDLNLGREAIFERNLILIFWLNRKSFLDEFRRRAPDFWDWRGKVATFETGPPLHALLYPYLEWLIAENSYLRMSGVMQVNRQVDIFLDQIYVSLKAQWEEQRSQSFRELVTSGEGKVSSSRASWNKQGEPEVWESGLKDESKLLEVNAEPLSRQRVTKIVDLAEAVGKYDYSVILGDPGAGKTTLLRYLARHFAIANRDGKATVLGGMEEELGQPRLPILFRIADYAESLATQPDLTLVDYLKQFYRQWEDYFEASDGDKVANLLLEKMEAGNCILLLDGLDEVFDQSNRVQVVQQINQLVYAYRNNKFVITSRIAGYQEAALGKWFREFTIVPMENTQIQQFLERWCLAIEVAQRPEADSSLHQRDAALEAEGILEAIETKPGVKRFAANPLLLTILALIHRNGTQLPQRRVELYELATKTLIEDWQLGRNVPYRAKKKQLMLVEEEVTTLLAPLAFQMHQHKPSGLVTKKEVEEWLTPKMAELQGVEESEALELVKEFLRKVRETTGLFVERAPDVYGFMHLTFEEYFAARDIADNEIDDILSIINSYRHQARWNEPILLALGYFSQDQRRLHRLLGKLFSDLGNYQPIIAGKEIQLKNAAAANPVMVWFSQPEGEVQESDSVWQDLLFVGQVLAEVKVMPNFCRQQVEKLVLTYLGLNKYFSDESTQQLLNRLRGIEAFNHQVLERLQQAAEDEQLSEEQRNEALAAILYVVCGEVGETLTDYVTAIVQQLTPSLFYEIRNLVEELGVEMTPALKRSLEDTSLDVSQRQALEFITGLSCLRSDHYERAIASLKLLVDNTNSHLEGFIFWALAIAYEEKDDYQQGLQYYPKCSQKLQVGSDSTGILFLWCNWGVCHRSHKQYEQSLECFQQALTISRASNNSKAEANILGNIGISYQDWEKYEEAIDYYQQSCKLYQQLGKETDVADLWYRIGDCYRNWGKYEQALEAQQQDLTIRQRLDDQPRIALAYYQMGRIYQDWGQYQQAIDYYQQSRQLYEQLGKETDVADLWYWLAVSYCNWGKYEQALEAQQQDLTIRQRFDDQPNIAFAYFQLGYIYQDWKKYQQAIDYYQQSRQLYEQLGKETHVADQWYNLAYCYRQWGKYEQALEAQQQDLTIRQRLDEQSNIARAYRQLGRLYHDWEKYQQAIDYYQQSRQLYQELGKETDVTNQYYWIADCYRNWGKYEQALEAQQQELTIRQRLGDQPNIAFAYYQLGCIYHDWGKYQQALDYYQQSLQLYQELGKKNNVANQYYWIGICYRNWGKYEQALEYTQECLQLCEILQEQMGIATVNYQLGRIYQDWEKYQQAIDYHQQSLQLYQQLGKETNVADLWYWLAVCYRNWGKYEQALEAQQQVLTIRQRLDEQPRIALAYYQMGLIYRDWGKYQQALDYYQQSRQLYEQLGKETNVADLWCWIGICYRNWGKYEQALEAQRQDLNICKRLDEQSNIAHAYYQLGRIYQNWGKYQQALDYYQQSLQLYEQLGKETNVANQWYNLADCYRQWGKYEQALEAQQQELTIRQRLDDQPKIADAYYQLGRIYQDWDNYTEAIAHYEQSRKLYETLDLQQGVANQLSWLAACYQDSKDYTKAIEYYQSSFELHQALDNKESAARRLRQLSNTQRLQAKNCSSQEATALLQEAENNLQQAIQLNTAGDYRDNLAYDQISLALLSAEHLRWLPEDDTSLPNHIALFKQYYTTGFAYFKELGQAVNKAEEALEIARAYLEISPLENLEQAETLAHQSLQTFQEFNRRKLEASANKLLGEIYLSRAHRQESDATATASQHGVGRGHPLYPEG